VELDELVLGDVALLALVHHVHDLRGLHLEVIDVLLGRAALGVRPRRLRERDGGQHGGCREGGEAIRELHREHG
jgi:hypothetical protein